MTSPAESPGRPTRTAPAPPSGLLGDGSAIHLTQVPLETRRRVSRFTSLGEGGNQALRPTTVKAKLIHEKKTWLFRLICPQRGQKNWEGGDRYSVSQQ